MNTNVYWLSVITGIGKGLAFWGGLTALAGVGLFIAYCIAQTEEDAPAVLKERRHFRNCMLVGASMLLVQSFIPTLDDLKTAFLYTEAAKLATAENGEKVAVEIGKRVDRILSVLEKK